MPRSAGRQTRVAGAADRARAAADLQEAVPLLGPALLAGALGLGIGFLINDSGTAIPAVGAPVPETAPAVAPAPAQPAGGARPDGPATTGGEGAR